MARASGRCARRAASCEAIEHSGKRIEGVRVRPLRECRLGRPGKVRGVRFDTLSKICEVLNCQPGDLLEYRADDMSGDREPETLRRRA